MQSNEEDAYDNSRRRYRGESLAFPLRRRLPPPPRRHAGREVVAIQESDAGLVARRAAEVGSPPTFTDYRQMLATTRPDFVVALGRHRQMAGIAHDLLDQGYPFLMEKPMGINAPEVEAVAAKAARLGAFVAVPLAQRYGPFAKRARELLAAERFGPTLWGEVW